MSKTFFRNTLSLLLLVWTLTFTSCMFSVNGTGPVITKARAINSFDMITVDIPANVTIVMSDSTGFAITAQENIIENIRSEESGNKLELTSKRNYRTSKPVEIVISTNQLKSIKLNGSGNIKVLNLVKGEKMALKINGSGNIQLPVDMISMDSQINGSGDINLSGKTVDHTIVINGSGNLRAEQLETDNYQIKINGSGDAIVKANGKMDVRLIGSGNVHYTGSPAIETKITGSGEVRKTN